MIRRDIITGEYPPHRGGVAGYTHTVAQALAAAGEEVHVWTGGDDAASTSADGVVVHRALGDFAGRALARADAQLAAGPARRLLVQWVPHAFGRASLNLAFCRWIRRRARSHGNVVEVVVHEPFLPFTGGARQRAAAAMHRLMFATLMSAASRAWMTTPAWQGLCAPFAPRCPFEWLPVPSGIPIDPDRIDWARVRRTFALPVSAPLIASFGGCGVGHAEALRLTLRGLLDAGRPAHLVVIGTGSEPLRAAVVAGNPALGPLVHATRSLGDVEISALLRAADLAVQPYADGVCGRRSSVMACLLHGVPTITTDGRFTEPVWRDGGVRLVRDGASAAADAVALLGDPDARSALGIAGRALYDRCFAVEHVVAALRRETVQVAP